MWCNIEACLHNHHCSGRAVNVEYYELVSVFLPSLPSKQITYFSTTLYCHLWPIWLYHIFPHYLIKGTIFGKMLLNIKFVFLFSLQVWCETLLILRRIQWIVVINVRKCSYKVPIVLVRPEFSRQIFENPQMSNFMNICLVGVQLDDWPWYSLSYHIIQPIISRYTVYHITYSLSYHVIQSIISRYTVYHITLYSLSYHIIQSIISRYTVYHITLYSLSYHVIQSIMSRYTVYHITLYSLSYQLYSLSYHVIKSIISRYTVYHITLYSLSYHVIKSITSHYT